MLLTSSAKVAAALRTPQASVGWEAGGGPGVGQPRQARIARLQQPRAAAANRLERDKRRQDTVEYAKPFAVRRQTVI